MEPNPGPTGAEDGRLRPGAKRVTFPSDEDIVSGAVEPKDPWRHGNGVGRGWFGGPGWAWWDPNRGSVGPRGVRAGISSRGSVGQKRVCVGVRNGASVGPAVGPAVGPPWAGIGAFSGPEAEALENPKMDPSWGSNRGVNGSGIGGSVGSEVGVWESETSAVRSKTGLCGA